jgi:hypothetical protein
MTMTTNPTDEYVPSEQDWADMDRSFTCMRAKKLVEKAMNASEVLELTRAFGLVPDPELVARAEQESYAFDLIAQQEAVEVVADWD